MKMLTFEFSPKIANHQKRLIDVQLIKKPLMFLNVLITFFLKGTFIFLSGCFNLIILALSNRSERRMKKDNFSFLTFFYRFTNYQE